MNDVAALHGQVDERVHVRPAFTFIVVENGGIGPATNNQGHAPRKSRRITNSRTHALTKKRWCLVRRIAGNQQPAAPPAVCDQRLKHVKRRTLERGVLRSEPGLEE